MFRMLFKLNKPAREIILHAGLQKTGSSSIQDTLFDNFNNSLLEQFNVMYPKSWGANQSFIIYSAFCDRPEDYHLNIVYGYSKEKIEEINKANLKKLEDELCDRIQKSNCSKIIISAESISLLTKENLISLKQYLLSVLPKSSFKVMVYVRNPITWAVSMIQQYIKAFGIGTDYETAVNNVLAVMEAFPANRIEPLIEAFDRENVFLYKFEDAAKHAYGLVGHFLSHIGIGESAIRQLKIHKSNESISLISADILSYMHAKEPIIKNGKRNENRHFGDIFPLYELTGDKFDVYFHDRVKLFDQAIEGVKWLKEEWGIHYELQKPEMYELKVKLSEKNLKEIDQIFPRMQPVLKELLLDYLNDNMEKVASDLRPYLEELINRNKA